MTTTTPTWRKLLASPWLGLAVLLACIAGVTWLGPAEKTLGSNVRVVYLHGAWVWTALAGFAAAALVGLAGLLARRERWQAWSRALGLAGLVFWVTYLPISMWAMQTNWNGLFLAEPRWRLAFVFSVVGVLLQAGLWLIGRMNWTAAANLGFASLLLWALQRTPNVMHPASPIFGSDARTIQIYFIGLVTLTMLAGWQLARLWALTAAEAREQA